MVEPLVQISRVNTECYTVQLLTLSSELLEIYANPVAGDTVLLLFLRRYDPAMFDDPADREQKTGSAVLVNPDATGYTRFSGVGILMKTVKASAALALSVFNGGAHVRANLDFSAVFTRDVSFLFDDPVSDTEHAVKALFGEQSPYDEEHWARTHRQYGMRELPDGSLAEVDAAVREEYSEYAPVTRDIQGAQTYIVGTGKDGPTEAPVSIRLDEKADIAVESKSGMTATFEKDLRVEANDLDFMAREPVGINDGLYKSALKPYLNAETEAQKALQQAAAKAAPQLAVLDALSGGTGFITGLGTALIQFCADMQSADTDAHSSISKAVK
jgi:hypothetical protein